MIRSTELKFKGTKHQPRHFIFLLIPTESRFKTTTNLCSEFCSASVRLLTKILYMLLSRWYLTFFPNMFTISWQKSSWWCNRSDRKWINAVNEIRFIVIQFKCMSFTTSPTSSSRANAFHARLNRPKVNGLRFFRFIAFALFSIHLNYCIYSAAMNKWGFFIDTYRRKKRKRKWQGR